MTTDHDYISGGCGTPGKLIQIPVQFLTQNSSSRHKILAHEFFKLRFGVHDEHGYHGDPVYPDHYLHHNKILPTGVSDGEITGQWRTGADTACDKEVDNCWFVPDPDRNSNITCSLGNLASLPRVSRYCAGSDPLPPTKHNGLCHGLSVQEIILRSEDLKLVNRNTRKVSSTQTAMSFVPEIVTVQEKPPRFVFLVETSTTMLENDDWRWINKALQKLLRYDLSGGLEVGLVTYSDVARMVFNMTRLPDQGEDSPLRGHLADILPDKYRLLASGPGLTCLLCGLTRALELLGPDKQGGQLVIISRGNQVSAGERAKLVEYAEFYQIRVSSVLVPGSGVGPGDNIYRDLARLTDSAAITVSGGPVSKYRQLSSALHRVVDAGEIVLHEKSVDRREDVTAGTFVVDSSANVNVSFAVFVAEAEDHFIRSVTLTHLDTGTVHGPYRAISSLYDNINMKTVITGPSSPTVLSVGRWAYTVRWAGVASQRQDSVIVVTARPGDHSDRFSAQVWTSAGPGDSLVTVHHPLLVTVRLEKAGRPVLRARVELTISLRSGNVTQVLEPVQMRDDGSGDPDLVADDGLYSRYLVEYGTRPGVLSLGVRVSDGDNRAVLPGAGDYPGPGHTLCCGSTTNVNTDTAIRTGAFSRVISQAASVNLLEIPSIENIDKMPPARIGNLRVLPSSISDKLKIMFTAPGDNFDHGETEEIIVVLDNVKQNLMDGWSEKQILTRFKSFKKAGETVIRELLLPQEYRNNDFYVGVVGRDKFGITGMISNIVHGWDIGSGTENGTAGPVVWDNEDVISDAAPKVEEDTGVNSEWLLILALCCSFFLMALCLLAGVLYFLKCAEFRKPAMVDIGVSDDVTDPDNVSHCSSEIRHMTADFPSLLGVTEFATCLERHAPDTCHTPSYWTASQLLGEHEARSRPGTLTPITEEYLGHFTEFGMERRDEVEYTEIPDTGLTNPAFTSSPLKRPGLALMESYSSDSGDSGDRPEPPPLPEMFSLGVQTVAPSCVASVRQSSDMVHKRQASLV